MSLLQEFVLESVIDQAQVLEIEEAISNGKNVETVIKEMGADMERAFGVKKKYFSLPVREESEDPIPPEILQHIPEKSARHYGFVPLAVVDDVLEVGITNPDNMAAESAMQFISGNSGMTYKFFLISYPYFETILKYYSGTSGEVKEALGELDILNAEVADLEKEIGSTDPDKETGDVIHEDAPITKIVANILKHAAETGTSDIHIEPDDKVVSVRYRVDGVLKQDLTLPKQIHAAVVARVKILSKIKLDEKRIPQDGRFSANLLGRKIDFRVSTFPTYYGEKVVMRLLEAERGAMKIEELGLSEQDLAVVRKAISHSYGMIIVCGPTGSGKTNTLYSLLNELDKETENILSLENPIELNIPGVSQSQMRPEIGYTFATGLRSVLRQDPDIIMVGEIRDAETAKLAIQASLTGHLVLTTLHTNTASDVVQRLVDMGVERYLIGPTLIAAVGQRLVRKIAPDGGKEVQLSPAMSEYIKDQVKDLPEESKKPFVGKNTVKEPVESKKYPTGVKGRMGVFEVLEMDRDLEELILKDPSSISIYRMARAKGMITFKEDAMLKALNGDIPFSEVMEL